MSGNKTESTGATRGTFARGLRIIVPFVVSGLLLAYLFRKIDIRIALDYLTLDVVLRFLLPLALFNLATLALDAQGLTRVSFADEGARIPLTRTTAARIKAACYLLGILNYALGAAGLSVLLRRRTGATLAAAAGMVFLISLLDIGAVLSFVTFGAVLLETETFGLRIGLVAGLLGAIVAGFAILRTPSSLGPLDAIRELPLLRPAKQASLGLLAELGLLRLLFVACFVFLAGALFWAFGIEVGLVRLSFAVGVMLVVSALPIAAGGLGTGQVVFVELFSGLASDEALLAASILFSLGMIVSRALIGLLFAPEFTREALAATREATPEP